MAGNPKVDGAAGGQRDYASLYFELCGCAGPQPSRTNPRADEHDRDCQYRREIEGVTAEEGERHGDSGF